MDDATTPGAVPDSFAVRAPKFLPGLLYVAAALNLVSLFIAFSVLDLVIAVVLAFAATTQLTWRAEVRPDGLSFRNRVGVDWDRTWSELRPGVVVRRPGNFGTLVRGRARTGRSVTIANGVVTAAGGERVAPATAQQLMQAWADAGTSDA